MKLMLSLLRRPALASLLLAMAAPATGFSADQSAPARRIQAPLGTPIQQVNYNTNCPNGNCEDSGMPGWAWGWGRGWGSSYNNGSCSTCNGGGLFGCGCHHGLAGGNAWVRPPATWPLARVSNQYTHYWSPRLAGVPMPPAQPFPMVYQPTDTAQMGFYYQSVPRWGYRPEMLPAAPAPNWPLGMNTVYGGGYIDTAWGSPVYGPNGVPAGAPVAPANPGPAVAPPPPAEPQINAPAPQANNPAPEAYFPIRQRQ